MQWLDDLASNTAYYGKLALYNAGLSSAPPIVLPADSIKSEKAKKVREEAKEIEDRYGYIGRIKNWLEGKLLLLVIVAAVLFFGYVFLKMKITKLAN